MKYPNARYKFMQRVGHATAILKGYNQILFIKTYFDEQKTGN